jgi:hypothetical protein
MAREMPHDIIENRESYLAGAAPGLCTEALL